MKSKTIFYMLLFFTFLFMLSGCKNSQDFVLINESKSPIKGIRIITSTAKSQTIEYIVESMDTLEITLNMKNEPTSDGHFSIYFNGQRKDFGYFTNGSGIMDSYKITFLENDVAIEEINKK